MLGYLRYTSKWFCLSLFILYVSGITQMRINGMEASYTFSLNEETSLQLNAGIQNMTNAFQKDFDTGAGRASSYMYGPGSPRSIFAGFKLML